MSQGPYDPQRGPEDEGYGYGKPSQPTPPPQDYGYGQQGQSGQRPGDYDYGYGQPAPPAPAYGQYNVDTGATLALILSIVALVMCPPGSIATLILSNNAARKVQETGKYQDASMAKAARIISIIGIVLVGLAVVGTLILFLLYAIAGGMDATVTS